MSPAIFFEYAKPFPVIPVVGLSEDEEFSVRHGLQVSKRLSLRQCGKVASVGT